MNCHNRCLQEDLEEFEVKEGMAMAEAEEAQGSGPGSTVSSLVKSAVDGSLTQTFSGEGTQAQQQKFGREGGVRWAVGRSSCSSAGGFIFLVLGSLLSHMITPDRCSVRAGGWVACAIRREWLCFES